MDSDPNASRKTSSVRQLLRQQRELQEKRKFGLAPLEVDTESHQEISPNIPEFISRAPWYYGAAGPTLAHQRKQSTDGQKTTTGTAPDEVIEDAVDRIVVKGKATKFTAGACKNCGSRTHKTAECFQAKKKVGSVYTNQVTGSDMETHQSAKTYSQKRDRFVGEVGVDLMRGVRQDAEGEEKTKNGEDGTTADDASLPPSLRKHRPEDVFGTRTAQHGGVEVKELPKYLHNLDAQDALFFDPKTGSMRANPNTSDTTKVFQGDLERYRSGDYYNYVEAQHRFLSGQSHAFVDFAFDEERRRALEPAVPGNTGNGVPAPETPQDVLLRSLYGLQSRPPPSASAVDEEERGDKQAMAPVPCSSRAAAPVSSEAPSARVTVESSGEAPTSILQAAARNWGPATRNGHAAVFGSFFDPVLFRWGYACCKATEKDAPGCVREEKEL